MTRLSLLLTLLLALGVSSVAAAQVQPPPKAPTFQKMPDSSPAWLKGYRFRWAVQVVGDPGKNKAKTVAVSLPTGGRLAKNARDVAVQSAGGDVLPSAVLSHDPAGDTLVQFQRHGDD